MRLPYTGAVRRLRCPHASNQAPPPAAAVPIPALFSAFADRRVPRDLDSPRVGTLLVAVAAVRRIAVDGGGVPCDRLRLRTHFPAHRAATRIGAPDRAGDPYRDRVPAGGVAVGRAVAGAVAGGDTGPCGRAGGRAAGVVAALARVRPGVRVGR